LYNYTGEVNSTVYTSKVYEINWTNLADGVYYYNASVFDKLGKFNKTETRILRLDRIAPSISINSPFNGSIIADITPLLNVTLDSEVKSLWYNLNNGANITICNDCNGEQTSFIYINEGNVLVNVYANDSAGNVGINSTRFAVNMNYNYYDTFDDNLVSLIIAIFYGKKGILAFLQDFISPI